MSDETRPTAEIELLKDGEGVVDRVTLPMGAELTVSPGEADWVDVTPDGPHTVRVRQNREYGHWKISIPGAE